MIVDGKILLVSLVCCFMIFLGLSDLFSSIYGIPFGMSDIDRYLCMWEPSGVGCGQEYYLAFYTHFYTFYVFAPLDPFLFNFVLLVLLWFVLPCVFYLFSREFLVVPDSAIHPTLYLMFGSYVYFFFGFMGLLAQLTSFLFFVVSMMYFEKGKPLKGLVCCLLSVVGHPYVLGVYFLYVVSFGIFRGDKQFILVCFILSLCLVWYLDVDILRFTFFSARNPQAGLFHLFFLFVNPLLVLFGLLGLLNANRSHNKSFTLLLLCFSPLSLDARLMPFLLIFLVNYAYIGLRHCIHSVKNGRYLELFLLLSILIQFSYLFHHFFVLVTSTLEMRGLNPLLFTQFFV